VKLQTFRIGEPARTGETLRIAATRRPPRGVKKADWPKLFNVWLPVVAPSLELLARAHRLALDRPADWETFGRAYTREMSRTEPRQTIALLAALARRWPIAIGCYCEDESRCHRSILRRLIEHGGAAR
jgi:uncharacterized protein YeaO (DUF488 family)